MSAEPRPVDAEVAEGLDGVPDGHPAGVPVQAVPVQAAPAPAVPVDAVRVEAVRVLAEVAGLPVTGGRDLRAVLGRISTLVREAFPAAAAVSVTMGPPESPELLATESAFAQAVDGAQMRAGEGPCAQAYARREPVHSTDVARDRRWPRLARSAAALGLGASVAAPVRGPDGVVGVLNVFATSPDAFEPHDADLAALLGDAVGAVVAGVRQRAALEDLADQLQTALGSRAVIEQAKGVVIAHAGCTPDEAFRHIARASQHRNVKVRVLAESLVADPSRVADVLADRRRPASGDQSSTVTPAAVRTARATRSRSTRP